MTRSGRQHQDSKQRSSQGKPSRFCSRIMFHVEHFINLAASLAAAEVRVLLVDCDPQSNSSSGLGIPRDPDRISTYHLLMREASAQQAVQLTELDGLSVIPAHKHLIGANLELVQADR